jgi:hypothetical protein
VSWDNNDMHGCPFRRPWLVVCSGMLLIVDYYLSVTSSGAPVNYKAYRLDMSTQPATLVEVVKLENAALFTWGDVRSPPVSCMSPGQWGREKQLLVLCSLQTTLGLAWAGWWCRCCLGWFHWPWPWVQEGLVHPASAILGVPDYPSMFYSDAQWSVPVLCCWNFAFEFFG